MVEHRDPELLEIMRDWKRYASRLRILSLSDSHENLALWDSYGDRHTGIAIRFGCGENSSLENPIAMSYSDTRPEISTLDEQIDIIMAQQKTHFQDYFPDKFLNKSKLQSKEKEWRLLATVDTAQQDESLWFDDIGFASTEIRAVYLGAGMENTKKQEVVTILQRKYPKARQFQAVVKNSQFELNFERLNPQDKSMRKPNLSRRLFKQRTPLQNSSLIKFNSTLNQISTGNISYIKIKSRNFATPINFYQPKISHSKGLSNTMPVGAYRFPFFC